MQIWNYRGLVYAYLTILSGNRSGTNYPLDPRGETLMGRGNPLSYIVARPDVLAGFTPSSVVKTIAGFCEIRKVAMVR